MSRSHHFADILQDDRRFCFVTTRSKLGCNERFTQLLLAGHANRLPVQVGTTTATSRELLLEHRIVDDSQLGAFVYQQRHRDARMRKAVHKVHSTIDRINDPGGSIRQFGGSAFAGLLFANETEVCLYF